MASRVARITILVATLVATAAIGASTASADPPYKTTTSQAQYPHDLPLRAGTPVAQLRHLVAAHGHAGRNVPLGRGAQRPRVASGATAFDWSAAAIGALAAAAACAVAVGLVLAVARRREPSAA